MSGLSGISGASGLSGLVGGGGNPFASAGATNLWAAEQLGGYTGPIFDIKISSTTYPVNSLAEATALVGSPKNITKIYDQIGTNHLDFNVDGFFPTYVASTNNGKAALDFTATGGGSGYGFTATGLLLNSNSAYYSVYKNPRSGFELINCIQDTNGQFYGGSFVDSSLAVRSWYTLNTGVFSANNIATNPSLIAYRNGDAYCNGVIRATRVVSFSSSSVFRFGSWYAGAQRYGQAIWSMTAISDGYLPALNNAINSYYGVY